MPDAAGAGRLPAATVPIRAHGHDLNADRGHGHSRGVVDQRGHDLARDRLDDHRNDRDDYRDPGLSAAAVHYDDHDDFHIAGAALPAPPVRDRVHDYRNYIDNADGHLPVMLAAVLGRGCVPDGRPPAGAADLLPAAL